MLFWILALIDVVVFSLIAVAVIGPRRLWRWIHRQPEVA